MIPCPICGTKTRVLETRASATSTRRRRICVVNSCTGKVTTVEVVVPEGRAFPIATGNVLVSARQIDKLRKIVASIEGGEL